jgi:hypothetical protein
VSLPPSISRDDLAARPTPSKFDLLRSRYFDELATVLR